MNKTFTFSQLLCHNSINLYTPLQQATPRCGNKMLRIVAASTYALLTLSIWICKFKQRFFPYVRYYDSFHCANIMKNVVTLLENERNSMFFDFHTKHTHPFFPILYSWSFSHRRTPSCSQITEIPFNHIVNKPWLGKVLAAFI